ncbi:MAG: diaminopimelate decarboxylase [Christensenellales bacterium]|jgi:diaminopimelate decarboxylase
MNFRNTLKINKYGHLEIGGIDTIDLIKNFGTPLYVIDESYFREVARAYKDTISACYGKGNVAYASKAFCSTAIYKIASSEGLSADVVSGGELYTALTAGFDADKIYFHGNNKLYNELEYAVSSEVGRIIIDNIDEIYFINELAKSRNIKQRVLVRVNPGVEAHTHDYIKTAKVDSKFGFSINNGDSDYVITQIAKCSNLDFYGLHCHIGSQIFDTEPYIATVDIISEYASRLNTKYGLSVNELNFGGGFGIHYTGSDPAFKPEEYSRYVKIIADRMKINDIKYNLNTPELTIEPGRSLIGEAGITLYSAGAIKEIKGIRKYVSIDGGMTDNIRPALYGAKYDIICANKASEIHDETVTVAGKCCESGDIIAKDVKLPKSILRGDIIAVFSTGAYCYSMASHYNRNLVPPVVLVYRGKADYIVRPETYKDLIRNDVIPERLLK